MKGGVDSRVTFQRERNSLINCDNDGKNSHELSFNLDQGVDVDLDLEGNVHVKNLLSFYKQKITLLENENSFLLNQSNFLQHQIDQNNKIILKILNNNSQVENNIQKSDNDLNKSNKKNRLVEVVKENISKLPKGIKTPQKQKKDTKERKNVFIVGDSMIKGLAERGISKDHNVKDHSRGVQQRT